MKAWIANHRIQRWICFLAMIVCASFFGLCWQNFSAFQRSSVLTTKQAETTPVSEPIQPLPLDNLLGGGASAVQNRLKITLGEKLFQDVRLSQNQQRSCVSCHSFSQGGADRLTHSIGIDGAATEVNTPTVFNARFNFRLNWNGKFANLSDHLDALLTNSQVMDIQWPEAIRSLQQVPEYVRLFSQTYPDGFTPQNIKDALVAYELTLNTPNARFDRLLQGDQKALTEPEKEGYRLFKAYGCVSCHQGVNLGGNMFQPFGVIGNYLADRGKITKADLGRFNVTKNPADRYLFRVPSLRNVAVTPPYFHDGSAKTLQQAIEKMTKYQLGRPLPTEQIELIAQFLKTLTGEYRGKPL